MSAGSTNRESPWRQIFEEVRTALNNRRDASGIVGSINWLRKGMETRGANPNVVRNIIYRDKGKLADKRVLFTLLSELWESTGQGPLRAPALELLLANTSEGESEVVQLLGREKRRAYQSFVSAVRSGERPKALITGKPGSGKTLLTDYIQQALELPPHGSLVIRQEFSTQDLAAGLTQLAAKLGLEAEVFEAKLIKVGVSGAYAVQADAQADVARLLLSQVRQQPNLVLLLHISQSSPGHDVLAGAPLRLSTPDVPRVNLTEWLWHNLLEPIGKLPEVSVLLSMAELPLTLSERSAAFEGPLKLSPPSANEARRFVRARAQHLNAEQQEALVQRAKRSFEDLRTLTLLAEAREPLESNAKHIEQLGQLVVGGGDPQLKSFLEAVAVLSLAEFPSFTQHALATLRESETTALSTLEAAFLDTVPGHTGSTPSWRPFSRQLSWALRHQLKAADPTRFRDLSLKASALYRDAAFAGDADSAARYVHHLYAARAWAELVAWTQQGTVPQALLQRLWRTAQIELAGENTTFEAIALQVAGYYARLGSTEHPDAQQAFGLLGASEDPKLRAWTRLRRAEGAVQHGHFENAEALLQDWGDVGDPVLNLEAVLIRANLARWYARLDEAASLIEKANAALAELPEAPHTLTVRIGLWTGLIAKDQGALEEALGHFRAIGGGDDLLRARLGFQQGDVLLKLGRFSEAEAALTQAVENAYRGEAPPFERARYLSRRSTLRCRQRKLGEAASDVRAAEAVLEQVQGTHAPLRLAFECAKVRDEAALLLLAEGRYDSAIATLQGNLEVFAEYGERYAVDPSFRILRTTLRLAQAYACRAFQQPDPLPLKPYTETATVHPDLAQAWRLIQNLLKAIKASPERYQALTDRVLLTASLLLPPSSATSEAEAVLARSRYPYRRGQARIYLASTLLRSGESERTLALLHEAKDDLGAAHSDDYALLAYTALLEADALLRLRQTQDAHTRLALALGDPLLEPYSEQLLRHFGETAETLTEPLVPALLGFGDAPLPESLRPPDALVLRWQQREVAPAAATSEEGVAVPAAEHA